DFLQETGDQRDGLLRLLHAGDVACTLDDLEAGAFDQVRGGANEIWRRRAVLLADDAQHRQLQRRGGGGEVRVAQRGAGTSVAIDRRPGEHVGVANEVRVFGRAVAGREPALHDRVTDRGDAVSVDRVDARVPGLGGAD